MYTCIFLVETEISENILNMLKDDSLIKDDNNKIII